MMQEVTKWIPECDLSKLYVFYLAVWYPNLIYSKHQVQDKKISAVNCVDDKKLIFHDNQ
jgi:hypothetical protein